MTNRMILALSLANQPGGTTAWEVFKEYYEKSQQPAKKVLGIARQLQKFERDGLLTRAKGAKSSGLALVRYFITAKGLQAGREATGQQMKPAPFMRLVKD